MLKVDDINVYYGSIHAIKGISFEVNEGEIVTLIGANGAGKSTTLNTISGLLHSQDRLASTFMGKTLEQRSRPQDRVQWAGSGAGGTPRFPADDGAGKPGNGRVIPGPSSKIAAIMERCLRAVPPPEGAPQADRPARFPAASSRCWPWAAR